eukprot:SAG31_NODE_17218_length_679_cov_0.727586_1_plen_151_part_10
MRLDRLGFLVVSHASSLRRIYELCNIYEAADRSRTSILQQLVELNDASIFDHEIPGLLVQFKWDNYARSVMSRQFFHYFAMTLTFTFHLLIARPTMYFLFDNSIPCSEECSVYAVCSWIAWFFATVLSIKVMFIGELLSFVRSRKTYLHNT